MLRVRFLDVIGKDLFLLRILFEVLFKGLVTNKLLFKLKDFLLLNGFIR